MTNIIEDLGFPEETWDDPTDVELPEGMGEDEYVEDELSEEDSKFIDQICRRIIVFCEELAGFELRPYQRDFAYRIVQSLVGNGDGKGSADELTALWARQSGKALALDTLIPTPQGWVQFGSLGPGDFVFGPSGSPVRVLATTPVWKGRPCYRVGFNDGTSIVADEKHLWKMSGEDQPVTTAQLLDRVSTPQRRRPGAARTASRWANRGIDLSLPIAGEPQKLSVDPYVLGAWLGDGGSRDGRFTSADPEIVERIRDHYTVESNEAYGPYGFYIFGLMPDLIEIGVMDHRSADKRQGRKHIPIPYLRAPYADRVALLQGLMDTDGYVSQDGNCEFCVVRRELADGVLELLRSLGIKARLTVSDAVLNGRVIGDRFRIHFSAFQTGPVPFHLSRKRDRLRFGPSGISRSQRHFVQSVVPVESVPVRCIQVEGGLFVAGEGWVVTHNSETLATILAGCMVVLPKLAMTFPMLARFKNGLMVGVFAPVDEQSDIVFSRIVTRLTSDRAIQILNDPEIDERPVGKSKILRLRSGSFVRRQTASPRAKIEGSSYHIIVIDEAQEADEQVVRKSIHPMLAAFAGTIVKIGTPGYTKGDFYKAINTNKRMGSRSRAKQSHFEYDYKVVSKYNGDYAKFIAKEKLRLGEDSEEFQLSYCLKWQLERGMLITEDDLDFLGDPSMPLVKSWFQSECVVGIDPARVKDSTVVTVCWVDWDYPDSAGYCEHRILNWLEIHNTEWEQQYFQILEFLSAYKIRSIAVDAQGMGSAVAERLKILMAGYCEVIPFTSDMKNQADRWKHLIALLQRKLLVYPAHSKARRTRVWRRFRQQMTDVERVMKGQYLLVKAPENEREAHDDYPDSLALACCLSVQTAGSTVEVFNSPFYR